MFQLNKITQIIGSDFNMVEAPQDKIGGDKFEWKGCEMLFWYNMINKHKLFDPLAGCK